MYPVDLEQDSVVIKEGDVGSILYVLQGEQGLFIKDVCLCNSGGTEAVHKGCSSVSTY